jgi:hypothetical protein
MVIDKHTLALISIVGSSLDVLGALYLAYDLLGGEHGPLRTLTRGVTYGVLFGTGYGLALGPVFGVACGLAHGITLGWEFSIASKNKPPPGIWYDFWMSAIRGVGFAIAIAHAFGLVFGITFGVIQAVAQTVAYRIGIRPTVDYKPAARPRLTKMQFWAALNRTVGNVAAGYVSALVAGRRDVALSFGLKIGLTIGGVTLAGGSCTPLIEWMADRMPERRMGVVGVGLILVGFSLQSVQYWFALLDVAVR